MGPGARTEADRAGARKQGVEEKRALEIAVEKRREADELKGRGTRRREGQESTSPAASSNPSRKRREQ